MRVGVVVDSACDLPKEYLEENKIVILPITIHLDGTDLLDQRDPEATLAFYNEHMGAKGDGGTSPFTVGQIKDLFLTKLVIDYDFVFCLTIASSRSPIFDNATKASLAILSDYKPIRAKAGIPGPFALRVIDSQNLFAAQGVIAVEAVRMIKAKEPPNKIRERLEYLVQNTYGYMLPRDLYYLRTRAQKKGDKSVGWLQYALGSALDIKPLIRGFRNETGPVAKLRHFEDGAAKCFAYLGERIQKGLLTKTICLSYGGDLAEMRKLPGYADLITLARAQNIDFFESIMSITGGINVGEGSLTFAFASEPHEIGF